MSDIRFNNWLHQSGTGGVHQDSSGNVGIGTSIPNTILDVRGNINTTGICSASSFIGDITGDITGAVTGNVIGNLTGNVTGTATSAQNLVDPDGSEMITCDAAGIVVTGIATVNGSLEVGDTFINSTSIGIGTTTTAGRNAGVGTAIGALIYNADIGLQMYNGGSWITVKTAASATGGTLDEGSAREGYNTHTFTEPGSFIVSGGALPGCEVLVVGGGGGAIKGGAGGGGVVYNNSISLGSATYAIEVGGGGNATSTSSASSGGTSSFIGGTVTYKGYGGGNGLQGPGTKGAAHPDGFYGSGGGGGEPATPGGVYATPELQGASTQTPSPVTNNAGNQGGNGGPNSIGGGGGGAGGTGSNVPSGAGGNALNISISGSPVTYAGGGGGGGYPAGGMPDSGPADPSAGSNKSGHPPGSQNGTANRGGGGGGYENAPNGSLGAPNGAGGSGIVIIAYPVG